MLYKIAHTLSHNTMKINSYNVRNFPFLLFLCHDYSPFCIFIFSQFAVWNNFFHITFTFQLAFNKGNYDFAIAKEIVFISKKRTSATFVIVWNANYYANSYGISRASEYQHAIYYCLVLALKRMSSVINISMQ